MGTVHDLIEAHGKKVALQAAIDRREVEAAAAYMADEEVRRRISLFRMVPSWLTAPKAIDDNLADQHG